MRRMLAAAMTAAALTATVPAGAQELWRVQTSMAAGESYYVNIEKYWLPRLEEMTGGELKIELAPVGTIVPYNETMDAIGQGVLQGDITSTVYFTGRSKAFSMLGDLIAGYDTPEQIGMFCYLGGGQELLQELYDQYTGGNVQVVGCSTPAREAFVSKVPIRGRRRLQGQEGPGARGPGLGGVQARRRLGRGAAGGRDLHRDRQGRGRRRRLLHLHDERVRWASSEVAKYPIYPGIHSMPVIQFTVNKAAYDALSPAHQTILDVWYRAMIDDLRMRNELSDRELVARDQADKAAGIEVVDWPQAERDKFRAHRRGGVEGLRRGRPRCREGLRGPGRLHEADRPAGTLADRSSSNGSARPVRALPVVSRAGPCAGSTGSTRFLGEKLAWLYLAGGRGHGL